MSLQFERRTKIRKRYIKKNNYVGIFRIFFFAIDMPGSYHFFSGGGNETIAQKAKESHPIHPSYLSDPRSIWEKNANLVLPKPKGKVENADSFWDS